MFSSTQNSSSLRDAPLTTLSEKELREKTDRLELYAQSLKGKEAQLRKKETDLREKELQLKLYRKISYWRLKINYLPPIPIKKV